MKKTNFIVFLIALMAFNVNAGVNLKNGSHVPQVDFPDYVNERIVSFLESSN